MQLYLARHGRTNYNDQGLCNSDPNVDVHLTKQGIQQAKGLAEKLKTISLDHIFISELRRTKQTAEIVNHFHNVAIEADPLLNDHRSGFESQPARLLMEALDSADTMWTARFNGGESIEDVRRRVELFLENLKTKSCDSVLVITSDWVIRVAIASMQAISYEEAWALEITQGDYLVFEI